MNGSIVLPLIGTAVGIVVAVLTGNRWLIGAAIREDTMPLREAMVSLKQTAETLTAELRDAKEQQRKGTDELHEAIEAVREVLSNHQERIAVLEVIANQTHKPAKPRARVRSSTT
jgi:hypothetical protein